MRYRPEHKAESRNTLLRAAGEAFRLRGFAGVGVDALSSAAGLTSGAFYKHFKTKGDAFREVVAIGLRRMLARVRTAQTKPTRPDPPDLWVDDLITLYLSKAHRTAMAEGCLLPALTAEVARSDDATRRIYQEGLREVLDAMLADAPFAGTDDGEARVAAIVTLLAGGISIARALPEGAEADRFAAHVRLAASHIAHGPLDRAEPATSAKWKPAGGL